MADVTYDDCHFSKIDIYDTNVYSVCYRYRIMFPSVFLVL